MDKFAGVGLTNMIIISIFTMVFFVVMKVIFAKYPVAGISDIVHAA